MSAAAATVPTTRRLPSPGGTPDAAQAQAQPLIDFVAASYEHTETIVNTTWNLGQSGIRTPINAYGFLRHILLYSSITTAGNAAAVAFNADAPWNIYASVAVQDVSGANIFGPVSGYDLYLINRYGGYDYDGDPTRSPFYTAPITGAVATGGSLAIALRIPIEAAMRTAFCALPNRSNSARYNLVVTPNTPAGIYTTPPTVPPTAIAVQAIGEYWTDPGSTDAFGRPVQQEPMYVGSTQYWSKDNIAMTAGSQKVFTLNRVGNLIRNLILINRDAAGARTVGQVATRITWDGRVVHDAPVVYLRDRMQRLYGYLGNTLETGVVALPFTHDLMGKPMDELMKLYVPTAEGTRYEFVYDTGFAGSVDILVNDIALIGSSGK